MDVESAAERQIARINVAAERDYLRAVLAFLREATGGLGLGTPEVSRLERAVETVCLNVVERGFGPGDRASFDVALLRWPGHLVVVVEDQGLPFDFMTLEAGSGAGLAGASLAGLADTVRFLNRGTRGNRVEIVKRLPFAHIQAYMAGGQAAPVTPPPSTTSPSTAATAPVTVSVMTPDDAIAVARCTYAVYGYTLPDDYLYFPDRMCEMLRGGLLEVYIGTTPDGEVASCLTCEVAHAGAPVGYLGEGLVDPRFRHHGLLEQMLRFAQRQIAGTASKARTATMLSFLKTNEGPRRVVYAPAHHRKMIERLYEHGVFRRDLKDASALAIPANGAQVSVDVSIEWSEASLRVTAYGADLPDLVRARLRELCRRRIDWIGLDLPLSHPEAGQMCASLEALGLFFAGIVPDLVGDDILRLQYLNEIEVDVASAQIASDFGKDLFAYVVRAMAQASGASPQ